MNDIVALLDRCRELGATLTQLNGRLKVRAPQPLPDDVVAGLREAKTEVIAELRKQTRNESECWVLEEWRRISIPQWRKVLRGSILAGDSRREVYARWMLKEVLEDAEYREETTDDERR